MLELQPVEDGAWVDQAVSEPELRFGMLGRNGERHRLSGNYSSCLVVITHQSAHQGWDGMDGREGVDVGMRHSGQPAGSPG